MLVILYEFVLCSSKIRPYRSYKFILLLLFSKYVKRTIYPESFFDSFKKMPFLLDKVKVEYIFKREKFVIGDHHQASDHFRLRDGVQNEIVQISRFQLFFHCNLFILLFLFRIIFISIFKYSALRYFFVEQFFRRFLFIIDTALAFLHFDKFSER